MSLFSKIGKVVGKVVKTVAPFVPGPIGMAAKAIGAVSAGAGIVKAGSKALPAIRSLPGIGSVRAALPAVRKYGGAAVGAAGAAATGVAIYDAAGNYLGNRKRGRRINPLNHRALTRALRRIEKVKHSMKRVNAITIRKAKDC